MNILSWILFSFANVIFISAFILIFINLENSPSNIRRIEFWKQFFDFMTVPLASSIGITTITLAFKNYRDQVKKDLIATKIRMLETLSNRFIPIKVELDQNTKSKESKINSNIGTEFKRISAQTSEYFVDLAQDKRLIQFQAFNIIEELIRLDKFSTQDYMYFNTIFDKSGFDKEDAQVIAKILRMNFPEDRHRSFFDWLFKRNIQDVSTSPNKKP